VREFFENFVREGVVKGVQSLVSDVYGKKKKELAENHYFSSE